MAEASAIGWTDATWSPVTGCMPVSPGCLNCYAAAFTHRRLAQHARYAGLTVMRGGRATFTGEVRTHPDTLADPLRWQRPRMVFVCSMSDLFHEEVPSDFIAGVWASMGLAWWHTFQVLTKRPDRAAKLLASAAFASAVGQARTAIEVDAEKILAGRAANPNDVRGGLPLPNVWIGTSIESQREDHRLRWLAQCPAALRFVSAEPLLGPLELGCACPRPYPPSVDCVCERCDRPRVLGNMVRWVIVGCESGPGRRPCLTTWVRDVLDQCRAAEVPVFVKQVEVQGAVTRQVTRFPAGLQVQEMPVTATADAAVEAEASLFDPR